MTMFNPKHPGEIIAEVLEEQTDTTPIVEYSLTELLSRVTPENSHEAVDFGKPVGNEFW